MKKLHSRKYATGSRASDILAIDFNEIKVKAGKSISGSLRYLQLRTVIEIYFNCWHRYHQST